MGYSAAYQYVSTGTNARRTHSQGTSLSSRCQGCTGMSQTRIDASHFSPDVQEFLRLLYKHEVKYLLVGGEAVIYYGYARLTGDVDFYYKCDTENASKLFSALSEFWGGNIPETETFEELTQVGLILQFGVPPNRIDLINSIDGGEFDKAWN